MIGATKQARSFRFSKSKDRGGVVLMGTILEQKSTTPFEFSRQRRILPGNTASNATIETVMQWMAECLTSHKQCGALTRELIPMSFYPTRILDLSNDVVVLREDSPFERYACLSHCWGPVTDIVKTTKATLAEFETQIPWDKLTNTFRDAIDICRRLGIFFLWIDSLCIIQDSTKDWKEQAGKMGDIYENAYVILAATKAKDSSQGCYSQTEPEFIGDALPGYPDIYIRRILPDLPSRWTEKRDTQLSTPLLHRAWCYQEIRLARRVLHFCAQEVIWQCQAMRRSESGDSDEDFGKNKPIYDMLIYDVVPYWKLAEKPTLLWYRTVQEYSGLNLTFESDKMPALAALTQRMEVLRADDQFLAGLWRKTLLFDMLWKVWPQETHGRPATRSIPTWSWASVHGQVMWDTLTETILPNVQLVDVQYSSVGPTYMGDITEAKIILDAPLIKAGKMLWRLCEEQNGRYTFPDKEEVNEQTAPDGDDGSILNDIGIRSFWEDYFIDKTSDIGTSTDTESFIIPMGCVVRGVHAGICVRRDPDGSTYQRFGLVDLQHRIGTEWIMTEDGAHLQQTEKAGVMSTAILESLPTCRITLI